MYPPVFHLLRASSRVLEIVGDPPAIYRRGYAPQNKLRTYVTWYIVSGVPENSLSETPSKDRMTVQLDCWADTDREAEILAIAVRDAIEPHAHMTGQPIDGRELETKLWRNSLEFDFFVDRPTVEPTS